MDDQFPIDNICFFFSIIQFSVDFVELPLLNFFVVFMIGMDLSVFVLIFEIPWQKNSNEDWFCMIVKVWNFYSRKFQINRET